MQLVAKESTVSVASLAPGCTTNAFILIFSRTSYPAIHSGYPKRCTLEFNAQRLIVYPLIAGEGKALFGTTESRRGLELRKVQQLQDGRVSLIYGIG